MVFRFFLVVVLLLAGCRSNDVDLSVTYDPIYSFPRQATFRWDRNQSFAPSDPRIADLELSAVLEDAAEAAFARRGYQVTEDAEADYVLTYRITIQEILQANKSRSFGAFWLDLQHPETGHRVWTGYGRAQMRVGLGRKEREDLFQKTMSRLLKEFPPAQR